MVKGSKSAYTPWLTCNPTKLSLKVANHDLGHIGPINILDNTKRVYRAKG